MQPFRPDSDPGPIPKRQYRFADFLLDECRSVLTQNGEEIPLRKQAYEMLVLLLEHQGELVSKQFLMDAIWNDAVVTENSLTQCLKEIRKAIGDKDLTIIRTVPRRGYIFELAAERTETGRVPATGIPNTRRWLLLGLAAMVGLAFASWWMLGNRPHQDEQAVADATPPPATSIAVLPFTNMSPNPEISYLADGLSEEILNHLAQIPDLLVIARTSSFSFRDSDADIATIGQQLNVAHVLEGSVRIEDEAVRVTVQIVRTEDQTHLWSQTYDNRLGNIFKLQESIAQAVAKQMLESLQVGNEIGTQPAHKPVAGAYAAYLRGQYLMAQRTPESITGAVNEFSEAVELDPEYAAAHAGLSLATRFLSETQYGALPKSEALSRARPHAERALELNPNLAEAHAAMAYVLVTPPTIDQALIHLRRAVELRPNYADGAMWLSQLLAETGENRESLALMESAVRSDPLSKVALWNYVEVLLAMGRRDDAERTREKLALLAPEMADELSIFVLRLDGQLAEAARTTLVRKLNGPKSHWPWLNTQLAILLAAMGMEENALAIPEITELLVFRLAGRPRAGVQAYQDLQARQGLRPEEEWMLGRMLADAGDFERALPYLEENWTNVNGVVAEPWFNATAVLALIAARRASGQEPAIESLTSALDKSMRNYQDAGIITCDLSFCVDFEAAVASHLSGDQQATLDHLARAVDNGFVIPPNVAYLHFLYNDRDLAPVFELQRSRALREKQRFLQMICPNNPYVEVWEPVEGTCEVTPGEESL